MFFLSIWNLPPSLLSRRNKDIDDYKVTRHATTVNKVPSQLLKRGRLKQNSGRRRQRFKFVFLQKAHFRIAYFCCYGIVAMCCQLAAGKFFFAKRRKHEFQPVLNISKHYFLCRHHHHHHHSHQSPPPPSPSPPSPPSLLAPSAPVCLDHIPESSASFFVHSLAASSTFTHLIHRPMKTET